MFNSKCTRCGLDSHTSEKCGARNARCRKCGKSGYYARVCKTTRVGPLVEPDNPQETIKPETKNLAGNEQLCDVVDSDPIRNIYESRRKRIAIRLLRYEASYIEWEINKIWGSTKMRSTIHDPCDPCDPYDPLTAASFPKAEGLFRTTVRTISHSWMLGMSVICFRLQFILQFVRGKKEVIFAKTAQAYFLCAQDVKLYSCLHHQSTESTFAQL